MPSGWITVRLDVVAEVRLGRQRSPKNHQGDSMAPYLRAANLTWNGIDVADVKTMNFTADEVATYLLQDGDVLLSEASGSPKEVGKPGVWRSQMPGEICFQNTLVRVRPEVGVDPDFLHYRLLHECLRGGFARASRGVGIHHIGAGKLASLEIAVPSTAEQARVAAAVRGALDQVAAAEASLRTLVRRTEVLREETTRRAVVGLLVEQTPGDTPATESLESKLDKFAPLADPDCELPTVPGTWAWTSLGHLAEVAGGVTKDSNKQRQAGVVVVPYLRVANVQRGFLKLDVVAQIEVTPRKLEALRLQPGDVLMNEGGDRDKLGRGWVWEGQIEDCVHQNHVFRARIRDELLHPKLLSWHGNSFGQRWFERVGKQTTNLASLSLSNLRRLPVPVPPQEEQLRIVAEVERQLIVLDAAAVSLARLQAQCRVLRRSVLHRAFTGGSSASLPEGEPAELLLQRIKNARDLRRASADRARAGTVHRSTAGAVASPTEKTS